MAPLFELGAKMQTDDTNGRLNERWLRLAALAVAIMFGITFAVNGSWPSFEESLRNGRDGLHTTSASGQIVVAELDAKSLHRLKAWPWPRHHHGDLLDQLHKAGVTNVAFDVDLSSPSSPAEDDAMAAALARFDGMVVLPTFQQASSINSNQQIENLPIPAFQDHAFLGSVNVLPDADGVMRNYSYGVTTNNIPRPSLGAMMAGKSGQVGDEFRIDGAIDPATLPRFSYSDILEGQVPAEALAGKTVLVGATAIELGDRYATPRYGVIPGVFIQALGAETLIQNSLNPALGPWPMLVLAFIGGLAIVRARNAPARTVLLVTVGAVAWAIALGLEVAKLGSPELVPTFVALLTLGLGLLLISTASRLQHSRMTDVVTNLPNTRSLELVLDSLRTHGVMAANFRNFAQTLSVLDAQERIQLTLRIVDRLKLGIPDARIHALQPGVLAWQMPPDSLEHQIEKAEALAALFISPIELGARSILVTPAFGLAERRDLEPNGVIVAAALNAERASESGQRWMIHSAEAASADDRAVRLLSDLETALAENQIWIAYQPKWAIAAGRTIGVEALVRWRHPVLGPISPGEFIPLLEREGRLRQLTTFVTDTCIADLKEWHATDRGLEAAINISAPLLNDASFVGELVASVSSANLPAEALTFEVTESAALGDSEAVIAALETLRTTGARVSIDDYGTGQSTLTYLKNFPADEIKIDMSFVSRMMDNASDQAVVRSTVALGHELGLKVVAEGVEDAACLAKLAEFGCDVAQGWHIGRPMAAADFVAHLEAELLAKAA